MTPEQLLDEAAVLMTQPPPSMRRCWQRSCACLTRGALEQGLRQYWQSTDPSVAGCRMRHQLLALAVLADTETAALACAAWYGLSRAMHHHTYELEATEAELRSWHEEVAALLRKLVRPAMTDCSAVIDAASSVLPEEGSHRVGDDSRPGA